LRIATVEVLQSGIVIADFIFAEAEKVQSAGSVRSEGQDVLQGRNGLATRIGVVEESAEIPPTLSPVGAQFESTAIKSDRFARVVGVASRGGGLRECVEIGRILLL
jgi:hypothetical protein